MINEDLDLIIASGYEDFNKAINHLHEELSKIRAGKASPAMVDSILVDYYGSATPLSQVANITASDSRTLNIQPWEKSMLAPIERAIFEANLGITPMNDGDSVRLGVPPLTEERRLLLVKQAKAQAEDTKIGIRSIRHKIMDAIKKEVKDGYPEDAGKRKEAEVQKQVDLYNEKVQKLVDAKEEDILKV
jgi:ribosome recycling factor